MWAWATEQKESERRESLELTDIMCSDSFKNVKVQGEFGVEVETSLSICPQKPGDVCKAVFLIPQSGHSLIFQKMSAFFSQLHKPTHPRTMFIHSLISACKTQILSRINV